MTALVTGSAGLVGSAVVHRLILQGIDVIGIDNDMRGQLFGWEASTHHQAEMLKEQHHKHYKHLSGDLRNQSTLDLLPRRFGKDVEDIDLVVHCASQPSHDWAAQAPLVDFDINARATLQLLDWCRTHCPEAVVIYMSTNKVYGDWINHMSYNELETRWEPTDGCDFLEYGVDESAPVSCKGVQHSLFGVSKLAGDLIVQEYGSYFGMSTYCLRCGCLTGAGHKGVEQHGFLSYLAKCVREGRPYTIYGHKGKQVRDNLAAVDVASAVWQIYLGADPGDHIYNLGGGRSNAISLLEAISALCGRMGEGFEWFYSYGNEARKGDHRWWITDTRKFQADFPEWRVVWHLDDILDELIKG